MEEDKGVIIFQAGTQRKASIEAIAASMDVSVAELLRRWADEKIEQEVERRRQMPPETCPECGADIGDEYSIFLSQGEYDDDSDKCQVCGRPVMKIYEDGDIPY